MDKRGKVMKVELQAELLRRSPKFFRPPGKRLIGPDVISGLENQLLDDVAPFDEHGIECGDGWFDLVDRLSRACENEIDTLMAHAWSRGDGRALPRSRRNSAACVFTCGASYPKN